MRSEAEPLHRLKSLGGLVRALVIAPALFTAACSSTQSAPAPRTETIPNYEAQQRTNWLNQIGHAGFRPLSEATAERRELRRIVFWPPYGSFPLPGVEIERLRNGQVLLRRVFPQEIVDRFAPQAISEPALLPESVWTELLSREEEAFRTRRASSLARPRPGPPQPPPPPPPICHAWTAFFASTGRLGERVGAASQCSGPSPQLEYANLLARTAVETRPDCALDQAQPMISFLQCFMIRPTDDENSKPS